LDRRKSDAHVPPLHPELFLLILAVIHRQKNTGAARPAARNPRFAETGVPAGGPPVFHELIERVIAARLRVRASKQSIGGLVIPRPKVAQELVMITRNLIRRLERLEAYLAPPSEEPAMVIHMTCVGQEDRIIEVRGDNTADARRRLWPRTWNGGRRK
jgi:hypothetical protein